MDNDLPNQQRTKAFQSTNEFNFSMTLPENANVSVSQVANEPNRDMALLDMQQLNEPPQSPLQVLFAHTKP
jgi:hypothetical protein